MKSRSLLRAALLLVGHGFLFHSSSFAMDAAASLAAVQQACAPTTQIYIQIYREDDRPTLDEVKMTFRSLQYYVAPIENLERTYWRMRRPRIFTQVRNPSVVYLDPSGLACAQQIGAYLESWRQLNPTSRGQKPVGVYPKPVTQSARAGVIEIWWPTPVPYCKSPSIACE